MPGSCEDGVLPARGRHQGAGPSRGLHAAVQGRCRGGQLPLKTHCRLRVALFVLTCVALFSIQIFEVFEIRCFCLFYVCIFILLLCTIPAMK